MPSQGDELLELGAVSLEDVYGVTVTYQRGAQTSSSFTAVWHDREYEVIAEDGFATRLETRDYVLPVSSVVLAGSQVEPKAGDRINETVGSTVETYQLMPIGDEPAVTKMPGEYRWLVHTKRVK